MFTIDGTSDKIVYKVIFMTKTSNVIFKIFAVILGIFTALTISLSSTYGINGNVFRLDRHSEPAKYFWVYSIIILGGITLALGMLLLFKVINGFSKNQLRITAVVLIVLFCTGCFAVIFLFPTIPMTDAFYVHDTAISFAKGDITQIDGTSNYYRKYSNNNMMVYLLAVIYGAAHKLGITDLLTVGRCANALAITGCELCFYFGIKKLTGRLTTAVKFLLVSTLYPTMMLMSSWVYTATFSMPLIGSIVLLSAYLVKTKSKPVTVILSAVCGLIVAVGYFLRPIVVIIGIAYAVCLALWAVRDKKRLARSAAAVISALVFFIGGFAVCKAIDKKFYTGSDRNFPLSHWVAMGLLGDGTYNQQLVDMAQASATTEEANKKAWKSIEKTLDRYTAGDLLYHQYVKHGTIWADGTQLFNQRIAGPSVAKEIDNFTWGYKNAYLCAYCQMMWLALQLLIMVYAISFFMKKQSNYSLGIAVSLLGAYAFYMLWEVKPAYATPFVPLFITAAVSGGEYAQALLPIKKPRAAAVSRIICTAFLGIKIFALILGGIYTTIVVNDYTTPSFDVTSTHNEYMDALAKTHSTVTQYFSTDKPFNRIRIKIQPQINAHTYCEYEMHLTNSKGNTLCKTTADPPAYKSRRDVDKFITMWLEEIYRPNGHEVFKLSINCIGNGDTMRFGYSSGENIDTVPGDFTVNGISTKGDLWMKVDRIDRKPYMTLTTYIILSFITLSLDILIYLCIIKVLPRKPKQHF